MEARDLMKQVLGEDWLKGFHATWVTHSKAGVCPECGKKCINAGLTDLVYTWEVCSCGEPGYTHLIEQLHHRACLIEPHKGVSDA